jgi:uncharacterized membrane protein YhdT
LVVLVAALDIVTRGIGGRVDKADTTGKAATDASTTGMAHEPAGIGGWLILLLIGQIGGAIRLLYAIVTDVNLYSRAPPQAHIAIHIELALSLTMLGLVVWSTVQMLRERSSFPMWWKIMAVAAILFPIVNGALISAVLGVPLTRFYFLREAAQTFAVIVTVGIWWLYLNLSVRVKNTFVT